MMDKYKKVLNGLRTVLRVIFCVLLGLCWLFTPQYEPMQIEQLSDQLEHIKEGSVEIEQLENAEVIFDLEMQEIQLHLDSEEGIGLTAYFDLDGNFKRHTYIVPIRAEIFLQTLLEIGLCMFLGIVCGELLYYILYIPILIVNCIKHFFMSWKNKIKTKEKVQ